MEKSILITGAGGGMGKAAVKRFAESGYRVYAADVKPCAGDENVIPVYMDVTSEQSVREAYETVKKDVVSLFAVIHLAGVYTLDSLVEIEKESFERIFRINLEGAYLVNRIFRPLLDGGSRVILVTSELAVRDPLPFTGIYAVSKAALDRYAYALRMELQLAGISVSVLRAGAVDTGMIGESTGQLDAFCEKTTLYSCNAKRFRSIVDRVEARRIPPEKVANMLYKIAGRRSPRFAYAINRNPLLILFDALPRRLRFFIIKKILQEKKEKGNL